MGWLKLGGSQAGVRGPTGGPCKKRGGGGGGGGGEVQEMRKTAECPLRLHRLVHLTCYNNINPLRGSLIILKGHTLTGKVGGPRHLLNPPYNMLEYTDKTMT